MNTIEASLLRYGATVGPSLVNIFRVKLRFLGRRHRWAPGDAGHFFVSPPEPPGISYLDGASIHAIRHLRSALAWYVLDNPDSHPAKVDMESLLSAVLSSIVLFDRLVDGRYLKDEVLEHLLARAVRTDVLTWVDLKADKAPLRRVILHPMTTGLMAHALGRAPEGRGGMMSLGHLPGFLHRAAKAYGQAHDQKQIPRMSVKELLSAVDAEGRICLPGAVAAYAAGRLDSSSLRESSWARLIENKRLVASTDTDHRREGELVLETEVATRRLQNRRGDDPSLTASLDQWKSLREALTRALHQAPREQKAYLRKGIMQLMEHANPQSTFGLLLAWGRHLLSTARNLKASSVVRYMKANLDGLQLEANGGSLVDMDDFGLIACYEAVLSYSEERSRPYNAARLHEFHDFLVTSHQAIMVDFEEIEPRFGERMVDVDASMVTPAESELLFQAVGAGHPRLSDKERMRVNIQHGLYMDSGLRAREPFAVRDRDVQGHVIRLRSTAHAALKTSNARRVVPLSARTRQWVGGWLAQRQSRLDYEEKHQLMSAMGRDPNRRGDMPRWFSRGLYQVSGDPSLSLRNFRHASATISMLCAAGLDQPESWGLGGICKARHDDLVECLNITHPSRRLSFLIAQQHGHGHPETTFEHYVHGLDILLFDRGQVGFELSRRQAVRLYGVASENLVSKFLERARSPGLPIAGLIRSGHANRISTCPVALEERPSGLDLAIGGSPIPLNFTNIHKLLVMSRRGLDPEHLSETFDWPVVMVEGLIASARSIEQKTGYRPYKFGIHMESGWPGQTITSPAGESPNGLYHQFLDRALVKVIEARVLQSPLDPGTVSILRLWEKGIRAQGRALFLPTLDDTRELLDRLEGLGVDRTTIHAKVSTSFQSQEGYETLVKVYMDSLELHVASRLHGRVVDLSGFIYPLGVALPPNRGAGQPGLNIACFLGLCVLSIHQVSEDMMELQ